MAEELQTTEPEVEEQALSDVPPNAFAARSAGQTSTAALNPDGSEDPQEQLRKVNKRFFIFVGIVIGIIVLAFIIIIVVIVADGGSEPVIVTPAPTAYEPVSYLLGQVSYYCGNRSISRPSYSELDQCILDCHYIENGQQAYAFYEFKVTNSCYCESNASYVDRTNMPNQTWKGCTNITGLALNVFSVEIYEAPEGFTVP